MTTLPRPTSHKSQETVSVKEVTKEVRDVSGLGTREVLVVRDVLHGHALQVRSRWRTETKKQRIDLIMGVPIVISLGAQASRLENLLWLGRAGRDRGHTCPSRHRHKEESQCVVKGGVRRDRPRVQERVAP
jgi:hypothetical protein